MKKLHIKDIVAIIIILGFFALKISGINGTLDGTIGIILGYYFVKRNNGQDNGQ